MSVFVLSSALNYLDRQILAALAPLVRAEFHMNNADYGQLLAVFSITYAISSPLAGLLIDRFGLNRSVSFGVGLWSLAGIATGLTRSFAGLLTCRAVLGAAESSGVPCVAKALHRYLPPRERALGHALSQIGLSVGSIAAPVLATWFALRYGWRSAFFVTGALGFVWIPLWLWVSRKAPPSQAEPAGHPPLNAVALLCDTRVWAFATANIASMVVYTLWSNWTTLYLKDVHGLTLMRANTLATIPHFFAYAGGLAGGWLSLRLIGRGMAPLDARRRACLISAVALLITAAVPVMPGPILTTLAISLSYFSITSFSVNLYTMPLDAFGGARAAFSVSLLTGAYGAMQALVSPVFGAVIDRRGYTPVILAASLMPLVAYGILHVTRRAR